MTADLITWLRTQLDEDERVAREAREAVPGWFALGMREEAESDDAPRHALTAWLADRHIARHAPARVLADVDAKRRILDAAQLALAAAERDDHDEAAGRQAAAYELTILPLLAQPLVDRPGYRAEWAVTE